jgi:RHS repeat-associated protein
LLAISDGSKVGESGPLDRSNLAPTFQHRYPAFDANGNVGQLLDESGGITAAYTHDPFGNVTEMAGAEAAENPWRFSTKPLDGTGLYYYGFRYYMPDTGRWAGRDPIEEQGGYNFYGFVGNDGIGKLDRLGLQETHKPGQVRPSSLGEPAREKCEITSEQTSQFTPDNPQLRRIIQELTGDSSWSVDSGGAPTGHEEGGWIILKKGDTSISRWVTEPNSPNRIQPTFPIPPDTSGDIHTHPDESGPTINKPNIWYPPATPNSGDEPYKPNHISMVVNRLNVYAVYWRLMCKPDGTVVRKKLCVKTWEIGEFLTPSE